MLSCGVRCTSICVKIHPYQPKAMANHSHKTEDWEEKQSPTKAWNDTSLAHQYRSASMAQFYPTSPRINYLLFSKEKYIKCIRYMNLVLTWLWGSPNMRGRIYRIIIVHKGGKDKEWKMKNLVKNWWPLAWAVINESISSQISFYFYFSL